MPPSVVEGCFCIDAYHGNADLKGGYMPRLTANLHIYIMVLIAALALSVVFLGDTLFL